MWAAKEWKAALVVLVGADTAQIEGIKEVAHGCHRPVLLVRDMTASTRRVVVATSLSDDEVPVVRYGVDVGARLGASVLIVHNSRYDLGSEPGSHAEAHRRLRSDAAALGSESGVEIEVVIARAPTAEAAVVELVALRNPEVLVLGSYPRTTLTSWLVPSVSQAIISGTTCNTVLLAL